MDVERNTSGLRRRRWTIGSLMVLVALCALVFFLIRPGQPAAVRVGAEIIRTHAPQVDLDHCDATVVGMTPDRQYWMVHFTEDLPREGVQKPIAVTVPDWRVRQLKRRWWWQ